jgi:hypothetical protein
MIKGKAMVETYNHNNINVSVVDEYKGKHKSICICHQDCVYFHPDAHNNCMFAQEAYELSKLIGIVLVMECRYYKCKE